MVKINYLVVGTGRCGTVYLAKALTQLGIPCGHESIFTPRGFDYAQKVLNNKAKLEFSYCSTHELQNSKWIRNDRWFSRNIMAESSYMAVPYLSRINVPFIHLVRNPLKVISSFVLDLNYFSSEDSDWQRFIYKCIPEIIEIPTQIERACYFYIKWNQMIELNYNQPHFFHRIEDDMPEEFFSFLKIKRSPIVLKKTENSMKKERYCDYSFSDIPNGMIKDDLLKIALKYNYNIDNQSIMV